MKSKFRNTFYLILMTFSISMIMTFIGCKRSSSDLDYIGPKDYKPASPNFIVFGNDFTASTNNANFSLSSVFFTSKFSERVTWYINIKGSLSGAVKKISGTSDFIDISNSNWDGNSSNMYFFRKNEKIIAELTIVGSPIELRDTLTIGSAKNYSKVYNGVRYTLIDDFEGGGVPMASASKDAFDDKVIMKQDTLIKVQGANSFHMAGIDLNNNSWSGGINHTNLVELKQANKSPKVTDPAQLYVNLYVYSTGKANSGLQIKMYEVDNTSDFDNISNGSYVYNQTKNDAWTMDLPINWTGWKLVSVKYSGFRPASDPTLGGAGNKVQQPNQISGMGVSLLSIPNSGSATEAYIDFVILTEGGPFVP